MRLIETTAGLLHYTISLYALDVYARKIKKTVILVIGNLG